MDPLDIKETLRGVDLFAGLDDELLDALVGSSSTASFETGDQLIRQGTEADGVWVITEGEVEVRRNSISVNYGPGLVVGDLSLLSGKPHSVDAFAKSAGSRVFIGAGEFKAVVRHHPESANAFIKVLIDRIYYLQGLMDQVTNQ